MSSLRAARREQGRWQRLFVLEACNGLRGHFHTSRARLLATFTLATVLSLHHSHIILSAHFLLRLTADAA